MKNKKKKIIISLLVIIEIISVIIIHNIKNNMVINKNTNKVENNNIFLVILLDEEGNETIFSDGKLPSIEYEYSYSKCQYENGTSVEDLVIFDGEKFILETSNSIQCNLYFEKTKELSSLCYPGDNLGQCLIDNRTKIKSLNDTSEGNLYRYKGYENEVYNNYVCFGTADKEECLKNKDKYMYRIIGVTSQNNTNLEINKGQVKLLKTDSIGKKQWHSEFGKDINWGDSSLNQEIDIYINSTGWGSKLASVKWPTGGFNPSYDDAPTSLTQIYEREHQDISSTTKYGLINLSDYYYANTYSNNLVCTNRNWLMGEISETCQTWTLTYGGWYSGVEYYYVSCNCNDVSSSVIEQSETRETYPVVYLKDNEKYISGNGTVDDPIMLSGLDLTVTANGTLGNNGWYKDMKITAIADEKYEKINSCTTTNETCTPDSTINDNITSIELYSDTLAQKACFQAIGENNLKSEIICSDSYKVDNNDLWVIGLKLTPGINTLTIEVEWEETWGSIHDRTFHYEITDSYNYKYTETSSSNKHTFTNLYNENVFDVKVYITNENGEISNVWTGSTSSKKYAGWYILEHKPKGLDNKPYNDLYRFVGTDVNNYVKLYDTGNVYRILGITVDGLLQLVTTSGFYTKWYAGNNVIGYEQSTLLQTVTGNLNEYVPSNWQNKIVAKKFEFGDADVGAWGYNDGPNYNINGNFVASGEKSLTSKEYKIGSLKASDYYYAAKSGGDIACYWDNCNSWLITGQDTWTSTRSDYGDSESITYAAVYISSNGHIGADSIDKSKASTATFYMEDVYITGGTGTSSDPFILKYE